jgi:DNA repair exonuclease SbcCD nuclease subunit
MDKDDETFSILVIGDPHFRHMHDQEGTELVQKCVQAAQTLTPSFIVVLGDVLDTHSIARQPAFELAYNFISGLSEISHTYVLMGNHDLINNSQFLTSKHFFLPYKKWPNVTIVDRPIVVEKSMSFIMCPYVPPGRFIEALETLSQDFDWETATCIFAHQEFYGTPLGPYTSKVGDRWDDSYPPVISGHIHAPCTVGNVYYPGSALQVSFGEWPEKWVWHVTFDEKSKLCVDRIDLGIKGKKQYNVTAKEAKIFDLAKTADNYIKLKITGTEEEFKLLREHPHYKKMTQEGIKIAFDPVHDRPQLYSNIRNLGREHTSFSGVVRELLKRKDIETQRVYQDIFCGTGEDDADPSDCDSSRDDSE